MLLYTHRETIRTIRYRYRFRDLAVGLAFSLLYTHRETIRTIRYRFRDLAVGLAAFLRPFLLF